MSDDQSTVNLDNPGTGEADGGDWMGSLPDDLRGLAEVKGWQGPADALKSYKDLESFMGADRAGRGLVLPKDNEDQEAFDKIYKAMGRPDDAAGYELDKVLEGEAVDDNFMGLMSEAMHKAGLSKAQAAALSQAWQGHYNQVMELAEADYQKEIGEVKTQVPPADFEAARRGIALATGGDKEKIKEIENRLGPRLAVEVFKNIGAAIGQDKMIAGAEGVGGGSAYEAQRRIAELKADPHFLTRYMNGDAEALARMDELYKRAHPGDK